MVEVEEKKEVSGPPERFLPLFAPLEKKFDLLSVSLFSSPLRLLFFIFYLFIIAETYEEIWVVTNS